jgi:hypothetical protein
MVDVAGVLDKLSDFPEQWIYLMALIVCLIPVFKPLGLPIPIDPSTYVYHDYIEALGPGDNVALMWEVTPGGWAGYSGICATATHKHLFPKLHSMGIKLFVFTHRYPTAPQIWEFMLDMLGTYDAVYGEDWVYVGFLPGEDAAAAAIAVDVWAGCGNVDYYGTSFSDLPMMADIRSIDDFVLLIETNKVEEGASIRQWALPYGIDYITFTGASLFAFFTPWRVAGLIDACLMGMKGGAEYEILTGNLGLGVLQMDIVSLGNIWLMLIIMVGNIAYHIRRQVYGRPTRR